MANGDKRIVPDHFLLILAVAHHSALVGEQKEKRADGTDDTRDFIADLSTVTENGKNLLELLIAYRNDAASIEAARFFCLWLVPLDHANAPTSALTAARACNHPALPLLEQMANQSPAELEAQRQSMIQGQLDTLLRRKPISASYALRNGVTESGKVAYVPQLQTCRVIEGSAVSINATSPAYCGLRLYDPARAAMIQCAGLRRTCDGRTELGLWYANSHDASLEETLSLGVRFQSAYANRDLEIHHIDFVSTVPDHAVRIGLRVTDTRSDGDAVLVTMTVVLGRDAIDDSTAAGAGCVSSKMTHFLPRAQLTGFLERANRSSMLNDLPFTFDATQRTPSSDAKHAENHIRYRLAHECFLQRWQAAIKSAGARTGRFGMSLKSALNVSAPTDAELARQIDAGRDALHETLLHSHDEIRFTLSRRDAYGECLLDHLVPLFRSSTLIQDAPLQCLLGATFASGCNDVQADHVLATTFYELAARHGQQGSYAGLGRLHEEGQAGLVIDIATALDRYQNGAARGDDAARAALSALSLKLASEHEAGLAKADALQERIRYAQVALMRDRERAAVEQAAQIAAAQDARLRAEASQRAAEEQPAATRSNNGRIFGLQRLRALFRRGRDARKR